MDKKCSNCGQPIPEESSFCLHCFTIINKRTDETLVHTNKKTDKNKKLIVVVTLIVLLFASSVLITYFNKAEYAKSENDTLPAATKSSITTEPKTTQVPTTEKTTTTTAVSTTTATTTQVVTEATTEKTTKEKVSTTKKDTTVKATTSAPQVVINGNTLTDYPADKKNSSYTIPYKVSKISNNAFNKNRYIKTLIFSKREQVECDWANLFANLPNLETVYVHSGTSADLEGLQYFHGEIIYFD